MRKSDYTFLAFLVKWLKQHWWLPALLMGALMSGPARAQPAKRRVVVARVLAPATVPDPPAVRAKLFQAASLVNQFKESEALAVYQEILSTVPTHYLALWQSAVLSVRIGNRYSDETRKSAYFNAARQYADRAMLLRPEGGESNYAEALALFNQATLYSAGARLAAFRDLRSHVYLATERRPDLPEAWQLLGRWQYRVAHYNLLERLYSKLVLGGVPEGGDSREAIEHLEKAHAMAPQNLQFCYDLARMCRYQGRRRRAIEVLQEADKISPITSDDLVISRLCRKMLPPLIRADARHSEKSPPASAPVPAPEKVSPPADSAGKKEAPAPKRAAAGR
ncbi:tetratricopeptide repeat protein [Hymenobacter sp. 5317J-9]|uniref:tetratricopeptide repeat protein n=1 Tax=Hymenobacter sp. 5317J-9 TaxID=2932250 RepID=UPI001FD70FC8|nr:tetratricopeptide repeat protein [Hymenobacter sp. 5317J-9]UOQ96062.1 tetratricopeptide repeat protein [Hymenobacter sp. 5317J-9]